MCAKVSACPKWALLLRISKPWTSQGVSQHAGNESEPLQGPGEPLKVSGRHGSIHGKPVCKVGVALAETLPSHSAEVTLGCRWRLCDLEWVTQTPKTQSVHPKSEPSGKSSARLGRCPRCSIRQWTWSQHRPREQRSAIALKYLNWLDVLMTITIILTSIQTWHEPDASLVLYSLFTTEP